MGERAQQCQNRRFAESSWKSPMKILTLRLKNLNSLKGEWKIDFTAEPFASSGLFAITGPTGAGKTTLLDAICLALYHRTPRMRRWAGTAMNS